MNRTNVVDRISIQVCLELESELGPFTNFQFLVPELSARLGRCIDDGSSPLSEADREVRARRVLRCVREVLRENNLHPDLARLDREIDGALRAILRTEELLLAV